MVERDIANVDTGVRFPSPAQKIIDISFLGDRPMVGPRYQSEAWYGASTRRSLSRTVLRSRLMVGHQPLEL